MNINVGGGPQIAAGRGNGLNINIGGAPQLGVPRMGGMPAGINLAAGSPGIRAAGPGLGPQALFGGAQAGLGLSFGAGIGIGPGASPAGGMIAGASLYAQAGVFV